MERLGLVVTAKGWKKLGGVSQQVPPEVTSGYGLTVGFKRKTEARANPLLA